MVSDCCGAMIRFQDICGRCGEHCEPIENDSDDGYDAAVEAYWNGYGPPVTRRQREDEEMEREEYRRMQRGGY